jgi:flagellar protein FliT
MPDDGRLLRTRDGGAAGLIERYEAIAAVSRQMLAAARADDWVEVKRLEHRCRELIAALQAVARTHRLSVAEQRRRIELLRGILADDAEMRQRAEPWLKQLERMLVARAPKRVARG